MKSKFPRSYESINTVGPYDVLLAGCALARGLTLVSANRAEFGRIAGLATEDWR